MKKGNDFYRCRRTGILFFFLFLSAICGTRLAAQKDFVQQILLDKPVQAGKLKVFPSFGVDSNKYYYLPNKLRLATDDNGRPKFLFLYYVTNEGSGDAEELALVGKTGGYVHLVVGLHVLPDELDEARMELKRINPKGVIMGPVIYRGGTMALVTKSVITNSSSDNPDPGAKRVLGIGPAPVMEGDNVAVSFILDSLDARIMWESLQTPTPDISFNLNMTIGGFQSPLSFKIDMDFDQIYQHKIFNAGLATPILKAEIGIAAQELKESGAIHITQVGEDAGLQRMQEAILNKFLELCFVPFGGEGSPDWNALGKPLNDGKSYLDRASEALDKETKAADDRNRDIRAENLKKQHDYDELVRKKNESEARVTALKEELRRKNEAAEEADRKAKAEQDAQKKKAAEAEAATKKEEAKVTEQKKVEEESTLADWWSALRKKMAEMKDDKTEKKTETVTDKKTETPVTTEKEKTTGKDTAPVTTTTDKTAKTDTIAKPDLKKEIPRPSIAVVASYQQRKIRHTGHFTAEAKTYFTTTLAEPFGDNIGKVNCRDCIKKINTYDPLYVQREVICYLDGQLSNDFDKYVNFVTVSMRKTHAGGDITTQEVVIKRTNFNKEGNRFKLLYGWMKGDDDRRSWLNYEYKTTWNFFGGATIETDWTSSELPVIPLAPPVKKYTVFFDSDPDKLKEQNIRAITVRVYYTIAGVEQMRQASLNVSKGVNSVSLDYLLPGNEKDYEYEVEWTRGNTNVKSPRTRTSQSIIFVDQVQ